MTDGTSTTTAGSRRSGGRTLAIAVAVALLLTVPVAAATTGPTSQTDDRVPEHRSFVVALDADGSATVSLVTTFDLTTDAEREAFETLRSNETTRDRRTAQFAERMRHVAARSGNETDRSMRIRDAAMSFDTRNETGFVTLSTTWDGLAATDGDRLVLDRPFDGGFAIDRPVHVRLPDGYAATTVTPAPDQRADAVLRWAPDTDFTGFEVIATPTDNSASTGGLTSVDLASIGLGVIAVAAVGSSGLLLYRRRN